MLTNVSTKTLRDRFTPIVVGAVSTGVMLVFAMAVYRDIDVGFYFEVLPTPLLEMMGIPEGGDAGALAFGAMYSLIGAFVLAGLAISMGASAVAGEEKEGTIGLLLANPLGRRDVVVSKSVSLVVATALGTVVLWAFAAVAPVWLDIEMSGVEVGATMLALFLNALVYGFWALAVGAWTGSRSAASGSAVAVMIVGYLGASLLPLTESLTDLARVFPWHYFNGSQPAINGVDWAHTAVLTGLSIVLFSVAFVGIVRRDLRQKGTDRTVLDRLRQSPRTRKLVERIAGSARVSRISIKTASEFQGVLVISAAVMFYMGLMMGPIYGVIPDDFIDFVADFPDALMAMIGGVDMSTAAGFIQAEIFAITGPIAFIVVTAIMGARALAGEEDERTMGLLLGNPITRRHVIVEKAMAMVWISLALGVVTYLGTWLGVLVGGVDELPAGNIAAVSALLTLLGLVFGALALVVGAATGRSRLASGATAAVAVASYFMFSFFPLSETFAPWAEVSPFTLYLRSDPLTNGMAWGDAAVLAAVFVVLIGVAIPLFQRRDLRG